MAIQVSSTPIATPGITVGGTPNAGSITSVGNASAPTITSVGTSTDPNEIMLPQGKALPNTGTTPSTTSAGSAATTAASPSTEGVYVSQAQDALQTALDALNASDATVGAETNQQENELASNQAAQQNTFNNTEQTNAQNLENATTGAKTQGNSDLSSLDRLLGSLGAGGSSLETEEIPQLVDKSVAGNIAGADTTAATNDQAATVAWNTFLNNLNSQKQQLTDQSSQQVATNKANYDKESQTLNAIISALKADPTDTSDLGYELNSAIGQVPSVVNWTPSYSGTTPVYQTPTLSNFTLPASTIAAQAGTAAPVSGAAVIPWLAAQQQQQTAAAS